jgi:cyclopropane fatty-acyl-phospholipid synthase-like methyltransferase
LIQYPDNDPVGRKLGLEGAGIMAYQTGDQMHPPMVADERMWCDARNWRAGGVAHTRAAAHLVALRPDERVLDIGCGICGAARTLVDESGVSIFAIANAEHMLSTARTINATNPRWSDRIQVAWHDCQQPLEYGLFDAAWSMNMIYRVPDKRAMLRNAAAALRPGGRLMLEDWMFTHLADDRDRDAMREHHLAGGMLHLSELDALVASAGFDVRAREDLGHVGRSMLARHFVPQFNARVRPRLEADFPEPPLSGAQMADEWVAGIEETIRLYRAGKMTYLRVVATVG